MNWNGEERRRFPRAVFPCKIMVSYQQKMLHSHTENISSGGIRVFLKEKLYYRTSVSLELFLEENRIVRSEGRVVWIVEKVNPVEGNPVMFDTGVEFMNMNEFDRAYITKMVGELLHNHASDNSENAQR